MEVGGSELAGQKYRRLAGMSPRTAVLEAWRDVEQATYNVSSVEDYADIQEDEHPVLSWTIERLVRERKLDKASGAVYEELIGLRQRTLHAYDEQVSEADAVEFCLLSSRLSKKIIEIGNEQS
jgi:hypothetical protein